MRTPAAVANSRGSRANRAAVTLLAASPAWRLRAAAYFDPGYETRLRAARDAVRTGSLEGAAPIEEVVPGWAQRL